MTKFKKLSATVRRLQAKKAPWMLTRFKKVVNKTSSDPHQRVDEFMVDESEDEKDENDDKPEGEKD